MKQTFLRLTGVLMLRLMLIALPAVGTGIGSYWVATQRAEKKSTQLQQALTAVTKINDANGRKIAELQGEMVVLQKVYAVRIATDTLRPEDSRPAAKSPEIAGAFAGPQLVAVNDQLSYPLEECYSKKDFEFMSEQKSGPPTLALR